MFACLTFRLTFPLKSQYLMNANKNLIVPLIRPSVTALELTQLLNYLHFLQLFGNENPMVLLFSLYSWIYNEQSLACLQSFMCIQNSFYISRNASHYSLQKTELRAKGGKNFLGFKQPRHCLKTGNTLGMLQDYIVGSILYMPRLSCKTTEPQ